MKTKYNILLSLWLLFIFLGLFSLRIAWKYNYHFDNKALNYISEVSRTCDILLDNDANNLSQLDYLCNEIDQYAESEIQNDSRSDYINLLKNISGSIKKYKEKAIESDEYTLNIYKIKSDMNGYITSYYTSLVIGIVSLLSGMILFSVHLVIFIKRKRLNEKG